MELSKNALTVLERRYLIKNGEGVVIETVEELFRRVAGAIAAGMMKTPIARRSLTPFIE